MSRRARVIVFLCGMLGLAAMWATAALRLPGPAALRDRYLLAINAHVVAERNITAAVSAVNFDYRGIDTLGEEFILFVSVVGALVLLREAYEKPRLLPDAVAPGRALGASDALRLWTLVSFGPTLLFGIYIILHGQLTPGGGFQGGVIVSTAALLIYLGLGYRTFKRLVPHEVVEVAESVGALGFLAVGLVGCARGLPYLTNALPLGQQGELTSGGTVALISAATGVEVAAGFVLLLHGFLQSLLTAEGKLPDAGDDSIEGTA